jgi:hypothetical protein
MEVFLGRVQAIVHDVIEDAGSRGITDGEIEVLTGLKHQTVSARRRELVLADLVHSTGKKRKNPNSNSKGFVWRIGSNPLTNSSKGKGDRGEREAEALLRDLLDTPSIRRALGAGRKDDVGDIHGVPQTAIGVAWWHRWTEAINIKLPMLEDQRKRKRVRFAALFIRRSNNPIPWIVVMTPKMWARLHHYAQMGVDWERQTKAAKLSAHGTSSRRGRT